MAARPDGDRLYLFLYVEDAARAFRLGLECYDGQEPTSLGSGEETSTRDLAALVAEATGCQGNGVEIRRLGNAPRRYRCSFALVRAYDFDLIRPAERRMRNDRVPAPSK